MSMPEIDRLTEILVLLKRRRAVSFDDIEWLCEEILRLREQVPPPVTDVTGGDT